MLTIRVNLEMNGKITVLLCLETKCSILNSMKIENHLFCLTKCAVCEYINCPCRTSDTYKHLYKTTLFKCLNYHSDLRFLKTVTNTFHLKTANPPKYILLFTGFHITLKVFRQFDNLIVHKTTQ